MISFGLIMGSFLYVAMIRTLRHEDFVWSRSHCDHCMNTLKMRDMIPVISYMYHRGHCPYCGYKISIRYPLIEIFSLLLLLIHVSIIGIEKGLFLYLTLLLLIYMSYVDYYSYTVYTPSLLLLALLNIFLFIDISFLYRWLGFILIPVFMILINLYKEGFGDGDIYLCAIIGIHIGFYYQCFLLFVACLLASLYYILTKREMIPFVPFISIPYYLTLFYLLC